MAVRVVMGYDGSPEAGAAIDVGGLLFPGAHGWITYLWVPPFASDKVRRRLRARARDVNDLVAMVEAEGEGEHQAQRLVATGVTLANAAGWDAEPLLIRTWGGEGSRISQAAEDVNADVVVVGSRGLGGTQALLGSVSDMVVHYSSRPMLIVPHPMLAAEYAALPEGPLIVGWDGSAGAKSACAAASSLFPDRDLLLISVGEDTGATPPPEPDGSGRRRIETHDVARGRGFHAHAIADALIVAARDHNAAAIVVGSRGHSVAREILLGSVAMATLHSTERPVMVVPREGGVP